MIFHAAHGQNRRQSSRTLSIAPEVCESRLLLSAGTVHTSSLANYTGNWQIAAGAILHLTQNGNVLTGTETVLNSTVANFTGTVHGNKFKGDLVAIGIDAHSIIKVHLTDATHFTGKRHYFVNGSSSSIQTISGVKM